MGFYKKRSHCHSHLLEFNQHLFKQISHVALTAFLSKPSRESVERNFVYSFSSSHTSLDPKFFSLLLMMKPERSDVLSVFSQQVPTEFPLSICKLQTEGMEG